MDVCLSCLLFFVLILTIQRKLLFVSKAYDKAMKWSGVFKQEEILSSGLASKKTRKPEIWLQKAARTNST